jgi:hypothetical protein
MNFHPSRNDRVVGAACLVMVPVISGGFLGLIVTVLMLLSGINHAVVDGTLIAGGAFAANELAICLTAVAIEGYARRRARRATHDLASF